MSRSFKAPWIKDGSKTAKNFANRKIRRLSVEEDIVNGMLYKRYYSQYDICDYRFKYNPYPWLYFNYRTGEPEWVEPEPLWKWNRK